MGIYKDRKIGRQNNKQSNKQEWYNIGIQQNRETKIYDEEGRKTEKKEKRK